MNLSSDLKYLIYKTTNLVNGKSYIGKHQTKNLDDGYIGSGKLLKRAIRKYGLENFQTQILEVYDAEWKMNLAEKILVVADPEVSYNLCSGGQGGFGYINQNLPNGMKGKKQTEKHRVAVQTWISENNDRLNRKGFDNPYDWHGKKHSDKTKEKMRQVKLGKVPWNKGKKHSEETKQKIRNAVKAKIEINRLCLLAMD